MFGPESKVCFEFWPQVQLSLTPLDYRKVSEKQTRERGKQFSVTNLSFSNSTLLIELSKRGQGGEGGKKMSGFVEKQDHTKKVNPNTQKKRIIFFFFF